MNLEQLDFDNGFEPFVFGTREPLNMIGIFRIVII